MLDMSKKYRLAIVDDHPLVRRGIAETLEDEPDFEIVAQGVSADEAVEIARVHKPDLMFLDVNMPGGGVSAAARIRETSPAIAIGIFSFRQDLAIVRACLAAGANGYIVKGIQGSELIALTRVLLAGETWLEPELVRRLAIEQAVPEPGPSG
jgi:two-component system, NarL family, nitrate/nitrite response regulator NarL